MDYKLAKQLKESNFPIKGSHLAEERHNSYIYPDGSYHFMQIDDNEYVPTLRELIDAVGDEFYALFNEKSQDRSKDAKWVAYTPKILIGEIGEGSTPEEAVANLYLAIHKK